MLVGHSLFFLHDFEFQIHENNMLTASISLRPDLDTDFMVNFFDNLKIIFQSLNSNGILKSSFIIFNIYICLNWQKNRLLKNIN